MGYCYNITPPIENLQWHTMRWLVIKSSCYANATECYQIQTFKAGCESDEGVYIVHYIAFTLYACHDEGVYVR